MSMELKEAEIKCRDSLNFLPMPLKVLPKTFGLTELKKGYFPHFFNRKENQQYVGPLPSIENYDPAGYQPAQKYSVMALQWLSRIHHQKGDCILHALNGGEQCIDNNYVDGYDPAKKTIYEFMGCLWHGCDKCYLPDTVNPVNDTRMEDLLEGTICKIERFKKLGFQVEGKWECEFKQELTTNIEMKSFIESLKTCAETLQQGPCEHKKEERILSGTWCSIEINKALELGYHMVRMMEIWHFPQKSSKLSIGYIDFFLKIKQEASVWPSWCETEAQKQQYITEYEQKEGIKLEYGKVKKNPGLCSLAKEGFVSGSDKTNVVIAAFTIAHARLKLYSVLERLQTRVLYFDTDSVIFTSEPDDWMPALGDYLDELTNKLDHNDYITTFVSGGPKNYAYQTKNVKTTCKVREFTLNFRGLQKLNFSTMCEHVCNPNQQPIFLGNPHFMKRGGKTKTIHTVNLKKKYKLMYDKRVVHGSTTLPYGYH
ncbi:uncharacterized protein [Montipora capricornis]|uniref:uncharacterized protein n=1 Tax=Montipora capricornis TaxID=246305 RepID=UPI0035F18A82